MRQYALRRMAYLPLIIAVVSSVTFFTLRLPFSQDPVTLLSTQSTTVEQQEAIRAELGLDKSTGRQFVDWLGDMARGDLGRTFRSNEPEWSPKLSSCAHSSSLLRIVRPRTPRADISV